MPRDEDLRFIYGRIKKNIPSVKQTGVCLWESVLLTLWCVLVIELHLQTSRKSTILKSGCIKPATFHYFQETCLKNNSRTPDLHCQMLFWFIILTSELCIVSVLPLPWWWRLPVILFAVWVMSKMGPVGLNFTTLSPDSVLCGTTRQLYATVYCRFLSLFICKHYNFVEKQK